jgi:hypothetical protein
MPISFNCRLNYVDAGKNNNSAFFRGAASRPAGLPRYGPGRHSRAATGQATTAVRLQTNRKYSASIRWRHDFSDMDSRKKKGALRKRNY